MAFWALSRRAEIWIRIIQDERAGWKVRMYNSRGPALDERCDYDHEEKVIKLPSRWTRHVDHESKLMGLYT